MKRHGNTATDSVSKMDILRSILASVNGKGIICLQREGKEISRVFKVKEDVPTKGKVKTRQVKK